MTIYNQDSGSENLPPQYESKIELWVLETQQRYFAYRGILVAIVSQNSLVLVFVGSCTIISRYVAKWGIAQMCLCETKYKGPRGGYRTILGQCKPPLESIARCRAS